MVKLTYDELTEDQRLSMIEYLESDSNLIADLLHFDLTNEYESLTDSEKNLFYSEMWDYFGKVEKYSKPQVKGLIKYMINGTKTISFMKIMSAIHSEAHPSDEKIQEHLQECFSEMWAIIRRVEIDYLLEPLSIDDFKFICEHY